MTKAPSQKYCVPLPAAITASALLHLAVVVGVAVEPAATDARTGAVLQVTIGRVAKTSADNVAALADDGQMNQVTLAVDRSRGSEAVSSLQSASQSVPEGMSAPETVLGAPVPVADSPSNMAVHLPIDATYYPASQLDVRPRPKTPIMPAFPIDAAAEHSSGRIVLLVLIDEMGNVDGVSVVEAAPAGYFEESAIQAVRKTRFEPGVRFTRPVKSRALVSVNYGPRGASS